MLCIIEVSTPLMSGRNFSNIFTSFDEISSSICIENEAMLQRATFASLLVNDMGDLVRLTLQRSQQTYQNLSSLVHQLCQVINNYNSDEPLLKVAMEELQREQVEWDKLDRIINDRKAKINYKRSRLEKNKSKIIKQNHYQQQNQAVFQQLEPQYKRQMTKREAEISIDGKLGGIKSEEIDHQYRMNLRSQFFVIKEFMRNNLAPMMQYANGREVPKKIILNIYMAWNQQQGRIPLIHQTGKIQMELTNQLKDCFPLVKMNRSIFRGIHFRKNYTQQLQLTDRCPSIDQNKRFDQGRYLDQVDGLLEENHTQVDKQRCKKVEQPLYDQYDDELNDCFSLNDM